MVYKTGKTIISYVLIASLFISGSGLGEMGFTFYWYYLMYIPLAVFGALAYRKFSIRILFVLFLISTYSLITLQDIPHSLPLVVKQIINISFSAFVFYNFLLLERFDVDEIIRKYIVFSKWVLVLGFVQVFLFTLENFNILAGQLFVDCFPFLRDSNISERYQSITQEPSYLAYIFSPVVFLCLHNLVFRNSYFLNKIWSVFFILAYLLTFSMVAYVGLVVMIFIIYFKRFTWRKLSFSLLFLALVGLFCLSAYESIPELKLRADDTWYGLSHDITKNQAYEDVNLTTYAFLSNLYVTRRSLGEQPVAGTGLGTYELAYDNYLPAEMKEYSQLNRRDANSLAFRLLTETGIVGFAFFCVFLFKYKTRSRQGLSSQQEFLWIVNSGIFVMIVLFLARSGDYTFQGRILFLLLYYYTYCEYKK